MGVHLGRFYGCPVCGRVGRIVLPDPDCAGVPGARHESVMAKRVPAFAPTDDRKLFGRWTWPPLRVGGH